ncbi:MAG TPA: hypothetical protein VKB34_08935, partial [Povalibacter sp.]|nr:hypothetical protein [Povalibacter sp.]
MNSRISVALVAILCLGAAGDVLADCAADSTVQQTQQRFANGQKLERAGDVAGAFHAYVAAQDYTCDPNPVEGPAAQRAAALALPLGAAAEKSRDFEEAFDIYEAGGQYAAADRALMSWVRANPDDPGAFSKAREALDYRSLPAFAANNKVRLAVTGAYKLDPQNVAEILAMPAKGAERAFQKEAAAFNEDFLRGYMQQIQSRPEDLTDVDALQTWAGGFQAFLQKWSRTGDDNLMKSSLAALDLVHSWSVAATDRALSEKLAAQRNVRLEQRATVLVNSYAAAPRLLDAAISYRSAVHTENETARQATIAAIRSQAAQLGDAASSRQRYSLALDYYEVAGQRDKAEAVQEKVRKLAMARMQP